MRRPVIVDAWYRSNSKRCKTAQERYLRDDIICNSPLCRNSRCNTVKVDKSIHTSSHQLSVEAKHYVVPNHYTILRFIDLFELADWKNIIFLRSVLNQIKDKAVLRKICKIVDNPYRFCTVFENEHLIDTYLPQKRAETRNSRNERMMMHAAEWFGRHIEYQVPIVLIKEDAFLDTLLSPSPPTTRSAAENTLCKIESVATYITKWGVSNRESSDLYQSILDAEITRARSCLQADQLQDELAQSQVAERISETAAEQFHAHDQKTISLGDHINVQEADLRKSLQALTKSSSLYEKHLPVGVAKRGVKSGVFLRGHLYTSKFNSSSEATVDLGSFAVDTITGKISQPAAINTVSNSQDDSSAGIATSSTKGSTTSKVYIIGSQYRNRAIHGDTVVLQLLPRHEWHKPENALRGSSTEENKSMHVAKANAVASVSCNVGLLPTAKVVCILSRGWRPYVATLQAEDPSVRQ